MEEMDVGDPMRSAEGGCGRRVFHICCVFVGKKRPSRKLKISLKLVMTHRKQKREMKNVVVAEEREKKSEKENRRKRRVVCGREKRADVPTR